MVIFHSYVSLPEGILHLGIQVWSHLKHMGDRGCGTSRSWIRRRSTADVILDADLL